MPVVLGDIPSHKKIFGQALQRYNAVGNVRVRNNTRYYSVGLVPDRGDFVICPHRKFHSRKRLIDKLAIVQESTCKKRRKLTSVDFI